MLYRRIYLYGTCAHADNRKILKVNCHVKNLLQKFLFSLFTFKNHAVIILPRPPLYINFYREEFK